MLATDDCPRSGAQPTERARVVFFNGLFDENVSSHMALENGITGVVRGNECLTAAERRVAGISTSIVHHDFTIGAPRSTCGE